MLHVYLPDYYDLCEARYPVVYFFDGHNLFRDEDATYGTCWGLKEFLDTWSKELIVVGIECGHKPGQRLDEYSPYPMEIIGHACKGLGEETFDWLIHDVKPHIDKTLRTWPHREATALAGSSMGGLMSLSGGIRHNEVFGKAACLSPSIAPCINRLQDDIRHCYLNPDTRFFLSFGAEEVQPKSKEALDVVLRELEARQVRVKSLIQAHGGHDEQSWGRLIPSFMSYLWLDA